jgi:class 3 adenylate cyclase/predicted ATPase
MDIAAWLRGLELEQYTGLFRDNDVDGEILCGMTAEDLKELGIGSFGHRRKLVNAIAALRGEPATRDVAQSAASATPAPAASPSVDAERRQLTVMFCDLVGSTALSTRHDPEDLRELIGDYHRAVAETVGGFDGFVAKYMGDGVLIYFGYPQAHEDDAERAVRAGLAVIEAVGRLPAQEDLRVRLGIATGLVVVGDLIGEGSAQEQAVVGETPNLAARLQSLAGPNDIIIADATRRQIGNLFAVRDLGPQALKGFAGATQAWQVLGESGVASRFEALRSLATPLVGREEEMELLLRRWEQAKSGEGRVVLISAEPGIGKSRLTEAVEERIAAEPHRRLRYFCSPHHQDSALYPIIGQLERAAGFARNDDGATRLQKLAAMLAPGGGSHDDVAILGDLLSLPGVETDLTPQRKKEKTFDALLRALDVLAARQPVLMVFEDVHWIDPTSLELLDRTIARAERLPVLLIATFRPEFRPAWVGQAHVTMLSLSRLGRREGAALVQRLAANAAALPADIIEEIIERTDGVPLFLEEVTKVVLEAEAAAAHGAVAAIPGTRAAVPATLQASLMARLDRLGPAAREIAQTGAAIGREFSYELVTAVAPRSEAETRGALDQLAVAGLVFQHGTPPSAEYQFKHALVQDTAYGTLLRGPRRALHARIAAAIETHTPDRVEREPELLAYHLAEGGESARAAILWRKAGEQAVRRAGDREAIGHFRRALALVEMQTDGTERWRAELAILSQLAPPMMSIHGWSAPAVGEVVERAAEIGRRLESSPEIAPAIANLWMFNTARGRIDRAREIAVDLFRMARETGDEGVLLQAHHCTWANEFYLGHFKSSLEHTQAGMALYDRERHAHHRHIYLGHDPRGCAMVFGASLQVAFGYPDRSRRLTADSLEFARELGHASTLANALWRACEVFAMYGDHTRVIAHASELLELTDVHGLPMPRAYALGFLGSGLAHRGEFAEGTERIDAGLKMLSDMGARVHGGLAYGLRAQILAAAGNHAGGLEQIDQTLELALSGNDQAFLAWLHRVRADLLVRMNGAADPAAAAALEEALAIAREQDAKGWEIGAATDLARVWAEQGRRSAARELLAPVYCRFTEGFDIPDLKDAKAMLDELA